MQFRSLRWTGLFVLLLSASAAPSQEGPKQSPLVVVDKDGEHTLKNWKFVGGVRPFSLAEPAKDTKDKKKPAGQDDGVDLKQLLDKKVETGPLYLEFREDNSTNYKEGILSLVPVSSLRKLEYDNTKKTVTATVVEAGGKDVILTGTTKYLGINKVTIEGEADLGKLGAATIKYVGGKWDHPKAVVAFRFDQPKEPTDADGPETTIVSIEKDKNQHTVRDLKALYRTANGYRVRSTLLFKKTVKIELPEIKKLRRIEPEDKKQVSHDFEVTLADSKQVVLTLVLDALPEGGPGQFVGLLGKTKTGYKLFPAHTIAGLGAEK